MKTQYYLFGGQPRRYMSGWKGYSIPGLTRVGSDTRGLSGLGCTSAALGAHMVEEVEWLPKRDSGPEPLDPGEAGPLSGFSLERGITGLLPDYVETAVLALGLVLIAKKVMKR